MAHALKVCCHLSFKGKKVFRGNLTLVGIFHSDKSGMPRAKQELSDTSGKSALPKEVTLEITRNASRKSRQLLIERMFTQYFR